MSTTKEALQTIMQRAHNAILNVGCSSDPFLIRDLHEVYILARNVMDNFAPSKSTLPEGSVMFRNTVFSAEIISFLKSEKMINAIKLLRSEQNLGLKEAKDLCEAYTYEILSHTQPSSANLV